jgi:hypothetical protein
MNVIERPSYTVNRNALIISVFVNGEERTATIPFEDAESIQLPNGLVVARPEK